jgi:uncharacterized protein (DUF1778 family)
MCALETRGARVGQTGKGMAMAKTAALSIRISEDMKRALEAAAAADRRTVAQYVLLLLEAHLQGRESTSARRAAHEVDLLCGLKRED